MGPRYVVMTGDVMLGDVMAGYSRLMKYSDSNVSARFHFWSRQNVDLQQKEDSLWNCNLACWEKSSRQLLQIESFLERPTTLQIRLYQYHLDATLWCMLASTWYPLNIHEWKWLAINWMNPKSYGKKAVSPWPCIRENCCLGSLTWLMKN